MVGTVIVTHGKLAGELLRTTEMVAGHQSQFIRAVSISHTQLPEEMRENIKAAIKEVDNGSGVLILTDMFGGTPSNLSLSFLGEENVEVISGVNLPMLLRLAHLQEDLELATVKAQVVSYGRENILVASEMLTGKSERTNKEEENAPQDGQHA